MTRSQPVTRTVSPATRLRWLAAAVLAALPVVTAPTARAQNRVGSDGRANDANNRVGGGGINAQRAAPQIGSFGNDVVNGNITAGKAFHGAAPSSDFRAFQGGVSGGRIDNFNKNSAGVGVANAPAPVPNKAQAYYGVSRETAPPPGFIQQPNGVGYVQAIVQPQRLNDTRLGNVNRVDAPPDSFFAKPTDLLVGGFDVATQEPGLLSASPLYGVRSLNMSNMADANFANRFTNRQDTPASRLKLDQRKLDDARNELQVSPNDLNQFQNPANLSRPLVQPLEAPPSGAVVEKPLNSAVQAKPIGNDPSTDTAGTRQRVLATPGQQSATYAELQKRLERYNGVKKGSAEESARIYNTMMKAKKDAEAKAGKPAAPGTGNLVPTMPPGPVGPAAIPKPNENPAAVNANGNKIVDPLKVQSMVPGVNAKGLGELLKKAEDLMKEGKFTTAIDQYAAAEQVAPNQPLIWIGRANAELGASYYGRAEAHLKQAFNSDKALLMAQYDLRSFLGEDRMASVIKDLKDMATTNQQSPTPVFLLAYIAYNTGNERRAAGYLDLADKRGGGKDPIYQLLRDHWSLPADENKDAKPPADLEKLNK